MTSAATSEIVTSYHTNHGFGVTFKAPPQRTPQNTAMLKVVS
jgi:hypothetical protein